MRAHKFLSLALFLLLPACAAQMPAVTGPSLAAMQRDAVDSVDITLGPATLGLLKFIGRSDGDHDPDSAAALSVLSGLHRVQVQNFEFAADHAYSRADLEALRSQLTGPGWQHIVQARDRRDGNVDIYCMLDNHTITRLVIIAAEPREFTLVNVIGTIDPAQVGKLRHELILKEDNRSRLAFSEP